MLSLRELQRRFSVAMLGGGADEIAPWVFADGIGARTRVGIYRNNVQAAFCKTLELEFPVIRRLVGSDYFELLAREFQRAHPSTSGDLHPIGTLFSTYLRQRFETSDYRYLADVAELEWAYQESLVAAELPAFDPLILQRIPVSQYDQLRFTLQASCRLVRTRFPVIRIWSANQPEVELPETIDLDSGADLVVVCRGSDCVTFTALPVAQFEFLERLADSAALGDAIESSLRADPTFDPAAALRRFVRLGLLAAVSLPIVYEGEPS
jgi:hypothetical protein